MSNIHKMKELGQWVKLQAGVTVFRWCGMGYGEYINVAKAYEIEGDEPQRFGSWREARKRVLELAFVKIQQDGYDPTIDASMQE